MAVKGKVTVFTVLCRCIEGGACLSLRGKSSPGKTNTSDKGKTQTRTGKSSQELAKKECMLFKA